MRWYTLGGIIKRRSDVLGMGKVGFLSANFILSTVKPLNFNNFELSGNCYLIFMKEDHESLSFQAFENFKGLTIETFQALKTSKVQIFTLS